MQRKPKWLEAAVVAAVLLAAEFVSAGNPVKEFYDAKKKTTERDAYLRCEQRLSEVRPGMSERELLNVLEMALLARGKRALDAAIDGYLAEASVRANRAHEGERHMVFGWVERGVEVPQVAVVLRDKEVVRITKLNEPQRVAELSPSRKAEAR